MTETKENTTHSSASFAELHDIGKLTAQRGGHEFRKYTDPEWGIDFSALPWQAIFRDDDELRKQHWPGSSAWALVTLGDWMAAGWGRVLPEDDRKAITKGLRREDYRHGCYCLWTGVQHQDPRLQGDTAIREMISFLNGSPTWKDAITKRVYHDLWHLRAEESKPGINVTSLRAHSEVAGKWARVVANLPDDPFRDCNTKDDIKSVFDSIEFVVARFRVEVYQRPFRLREWNVFAQRSKALEAAVQCFKDRGNVLDRVDNECICVFASPDQSNAFAHIITKLGFHVRQRQSIMQELLGEVVRVASDENLSEEASQPDTQDAVADPSSILAPLRQEPWTFVYPTIPPERIKLPICECCQMAHASRVWTGVEGDSDEKLCEQCYELRGGATRLIKLHSWGEGTTVAWVHVRTDIDDLETSLTALHKDYLREMHPNIGEDLLKKVEARYPLLVDFFDDYKAFLQEYQRRLENELGEENVEMVDENLWCVRLAERGRRLRVIELYRALMQERFPKLIGAHTDLPCPIRFAMSTSNIKHPFFAHWRFLDEPSDGEKKRIADVRVQLVGSGTASVSIHALGQVLNALSRPQRHALHRLRQIDRVSTTLAKAVLRDREDKNRATFERIRGVLPHKIDFQSMVTLTNLVED